MTHTHRRSSFAILAVLFALAAPPLWAQSGITIRIMPPPKAQLLQLQRFDIRVEATAADSSASVSTLSVTIDGKDITAKGVIDSPSPNVRNWTFRNAEFGVPGARTFAATASGALSGSAVGGSASSTVTVREWVSLTSAPASARAEAARTRTLDGGLSANATHAEILDDTLHLGGISPVFHHYAAVPQHRAKNVILMIGDGMGIAHRTAGRVLSKGYTGGKANGTMAMDRFPFNGMLMTSSLNSLITDSAPSAHSYSTGNKGNNGMMGVFPDNSSSDDDNPRIEHLSEFIHRNFGKVTGIVSDAFATDATLAAFLSHTSDRGDGTQIASQYVDDRDATGLKVLMGGGSYFFIPKSTPGSRRKDERDVVGDFQTNGYAFVSDATELAAFTPGADGRLLGLFNLDNVNVAFDKLKRGDPSVVANFPNQPFLKDMAQKAIDTLKQYPDGFFLMVEGAHIDKQAHRMDAERSIFDVIQFDQAVQVALDFATSTNTDDDPDNDTLVIVTADHECSGMNLPGVGRPDKKGTRDFVKTYNYGDGVVKNDSKTANFTDYILDENGYPLNPDAPHKLIVNFGADPDHWEDWTSSARPRNASATEGSGFDPARVVDGKVVANPDDPKASSPGAVLITGVIENGEAGGDLETQAVHTLSDIPISAYGPGASQFARVQDNSEVFFDIMNSMLGAYPVPTQF